MRAQAIVRWAMVALAVLALGGFIVLVVVTDGNEAKRSGTSSGGGTERPDTPSGRREFVRIMTRDMPRDAMRTEGANDEGLVMDLADCSLSTLNEALAMQRLTDRLDQFDFKWVRCPGGPKIAPPWR